MTRAAAMTAASALCLLWTAGCASTTAGKSDSQASEAASANTKPADAMPDPHADVATLAKNLPATLDGEIRRAQLLRTKGDYDEAAHSLAQLILFAPDDGRVVGEYGKVLEQQGHSQEALPYLKRAAQLQPNDWSFQSALGVAYDQLDDHVSARAAYERALALRPGEASILNNYAVSRMLAGDYGAAKRLFAQAQAMGATNPKIAGNLDKLAALNPQPVPQVPTQPAPTSQPAKTAAARTPGSSATAPKVTVTATTLTPIPHAASSPSVKPNSPAARHVAVAAPKTLGGQVVMQRVPVDPLAGPVHPSASKTASMTHKPAAKKPAPATPSLRTAADAN